MGKKTFSQQQKLTILKSSKNLGIKEAAEVAGVHYTTIYDWRRQLQTLGQKAFLAYRAKYPGRGVKVIDAGQETAILNIWNNRPGFGPGQVRNQLRRQGITISIRTIRAVMQANGYKARKGQKSTESPQRFEAGGPLELVQMDILEFFINKLKVYLILMIDDFSRFICGFELLGETSTDAVIGLVQAAVDRYGKMQEILTDRGFVFYSWRGINRFERYLENERIDHTHARPHHPQTLGKVEACNRRIKSELLTQHHFATLNEAGSAVEQWVEHYNYQRCHQGIGGLLTPAERFHGQARQVLDAIADGMDMTAKNSFTSSALERSIINVVFNPSGQITLYVLGQPITLYKGDAHVD